jgi:hypothetical protein
MRTRRRVRAVSIEADQESSLESFLSFRTLITPTMVKVLYVAGVLFVTLAGMFSIFTRESTPQSQLVGIIIIVLGNILWRVICEGMILFYSIHDILASMEREQRRRRL